MVDSSLGRFLRDVGECHACGLMKTEEASVRRVERMREGGGELSISRRAFVEVVIVVWVAPRVCFYMSQIRIHKTRARYDLKGGMNV